MLLLPRLTLLGEQQGWMKFWTPRGAVWWREDGEVRTPLV